MLTEEQTQFLIQSNEFSQDVRYDQSYPSARVGLNDDQYQRQNSPRGGKRGRILNIVSKFSARKTLGSLSSKLKNKFRSKDDPRKVFDRQSSIARTKKRSMQDQNLYFKDDHWDPSCSSDVQGGQKTQDLRPSDSGSSTDYDYDAPNDSFSNENNQNWLQESAVESTDPQLHERDSTVTYQQEPTFAQSHEIDMKREEMVPAKDNLPWISISGKSFFPRRVRAAIRVMTLSLRGSFLSSVLILLFQPLFTLLPSGLLFLSMQFCLESFTDTSNLCTFDSGNPWKRVCANRFNQCVSQEFQPEPGPQHILVTKIYNLLHSLNACILSLKKVIPVPLQVRISIKYILNVFKNLCSHFDTNHRPSLIHFYNSFGGFPHNHLLYNFSCVYSTVTFFLNTLSSRLCKMCIHLELQRCIDVIRAATKRMHL